MVDVELVQDHVRLGAHLAFFADDFDKLASRKGACDLPLSYSDDQTFVLQSSRVLRFDDALRHLDIVRHKYAEFVLI